MRATAECTVLAFLIAASSLGAGEAPSFASGPEIDAGTVTTSDEVELSWQKVGDGPQTIILPAALYLRPDFDALADPDRTLIYYDMRNRGASGSVADPAKLTIQDDVRDLEAIRSHFGVDRFSTVGYSYLGLMVVMYAMEYPERLDRIVQIGPVSRRYGTEYPDSLVNDDAEEVVPADLRTTLITLRGRGFRELHPRAYCDLYYDYLRLLLVGDPENASKIDEPCEHPNEWPVNFARHLEAHFVGSVQNLEIPAEALTEVTAPVLTVHGTMDRNAPYGAGREWALDLPNARLVTVEGAAHHLWADAPWVLEAIDRFLAGEWPQEAEEIDRLEPGPER